MISMRLADSSDEEESDSSDEWELWSELIIMNKSTNILF